MRRLYYFDIFGQLLRPKFKQLTDCYGNEFIVWENSEIDEQMIGVQDKTEFESIENHIHIVDNIKENEFASLCKFGQTLCKHILSQLQQNFPDKKFVVYVSIRIGDSMILRYHQDWENEVHYYDQEIKSKKERLIKCIG